MRRRDLILGAGAAAIVGGHSSAHAAGESWKMCILGDRTGGANDSVYRNSVARIAAERPEFVINVGDSIEGYRDFWTDVEWTDLKQVWRAFGDIPHYFTPGNHDIWSTASQRLYERFTGFDPQYSFTHRNCHVTVLDNSRHGTLPASQLEFLEADLKKHSDIPLKMVFLHKPFWVLFVKLQSSEFDLHRICRKHGVQWVISGHVHHLWHMRRDGIQYIAVGSSGASMERGRELGQSWDAGWFYHYAVMNVHADRAEMQIRELRWPFGAGRNFPIEEWSDNHPAKRSPLAR